MRFAAWPAIASLGLGCALAPFFPTPRAIQELFSFSPTIAMSLPTTPRVSWCIRNYQSPTCGAHTGGSLSQNQIGTIFRAAKADVDFLLLELEDVPDPAFKVFYSGWISSGTPVNGVVGIHHPDGGVKSISFSSNAITSVTSCIAPGL